MYIDKINHILEQESLVSQDVNYHKLVYIVNMKKKKSQPIF
jgi:hypothetical protein